MKKILTSVMTLAIVGAVAFGATQAFFSDTETSSGNTFTAGEIDLQIDYEGYYNKAVDRNPNAGNWELKDLVSEKFFDFQDLKPGDYGEGTLSFHVTSNPAWMCAEFKNLQNDDNGLTEPEDEVDDTGGPGEGELAQNLFFTAWYDDGDNIWEDGEELVFSNSSGPASDILSGKVYAVADSTTGNGPINPGETKYLGLSWCFGAMQVDESTHTIACDGAGEGNETQTDSLTADIEFYVEQSRNNPNFVCPNGNEDETTTLILENKTQNYNRILNDGRYGVLTFNNSGSTFDFDLKAYGLLPNTEYSLLYYADGWPGNNPGYWFGNATATGSGYLTLSGTPNLGMDLPHSSDANYSTGAKIWLIPSSAYNTSTLGVTVWPFADDWLFETNLITYDDTDV